VEITRGLLRLVMIWTITTAPVSSFQLQNEIAVFDVSVRWHKFRGAIFDGMSTLTPPLCVQGIKVISEAQLEHVLS
jgi:hypothetical protein